jgi:hypothetical protein
MIPKEINNKGVYPVFQILFLFLSVFSNVNNDVFAQGEPDSLAQYTPQWIREGFAVAGLTWEPWMFMMRRNNSEMEEHNYSYWQKDVYEKQLSEEFIKTFAKSGATVYHLGFYKGFGFNAEKDYMDKMAKAAAIAHQYGLKVATYIQWSTLCYETFFSEVPEAKTGLWYQFDVNGKPLLPYGDRAPFRYTPCFSNDAYMDYLKEKIIRYAVEKVKTDFIHFDNFALTPILSTDHNPATITAFRKYIKDKYSPAKRIERFGFDDVSNMLPPSWVTPPKIPVIGDPVTQEWIDFRCWILEKRLKECASFARKLNQEVVIEVNAGGLIGNNRAWEIGINHPSLMKYTNVIWAEDKSYPRWEDGVVIGKFRSFKLGRTTNNFILTYVRTPQDFAEDLALNRSIGYLGEGIPTGVGKKYLDFWLSNKQLYINMQGAEKVATFRSYPSMAYNTYETQIEANMAEQVLQQRQIPFDIIFDQQAGKLKKYDVLVLADQECLTDEVIAPIKQFVKDGGGLVMTNKTGMYDGWHRRREQSMLEEMLSEEKKADLLKKDKLSVLYFTYGKGRVVYLPGLEKSKDGELRSGFAGAEWMMPKNANELESAVYCVSGNRLPLKVTAPEWVGVSHDTQGNIDLIHLFNYNHNRNVAGIILEYEGKVKNAWSVSPDEEGKSIIPLIEKGGVTELRIPNLEVYKVVVLEKK